MIGNYLTTAARHSWRKKIFSIVNILGLSIGIAVCIMVFLWIQDEMSYDRYNVHAEDIYRVYIDGKLGDRGGDMVETGPPIAPTLKAEFPEVVAAVRIRDAGYPVLRYKDKVFSEEKWVHVDQSFFDVFTVDLLAGDLTDALTDPHTVVITKSMADKYFDGENPIGKQLNSDKRLDYIVKAVIDDFPENSHFHFDFLASSNVLGDINSDSWLNMSYYTYIRLQPGYPKDQLESKLDGIVQKYVGPQLTQFTGMAYSDFLKVGNRFKIHLQPLTDIHLYSRMDHEIEQNGNILYILVFLLIALFILLIACINFINLTTAQSSTRAKEVGVRKTLGAFRSQLILQFLFESVFLSVIALGIAVLIVKLALPFFNNIAGKSLSLDLSGGLWLILVFPVAAIILGCMAGIVPAFLMTSFNPAKDLRSRNRLKGRRSWLRNGLVIFQFSIAATLIISTIVVSNQIHHMQSKNLGLNKAGLLVIKKTDDLGTQVWAFRDELIRHPGIVNATVTTHIPGMGHGESGYKLRGAPDEESSLLNQVLVDENFLDTYEIELLEGRTFDLTQVENQTHVIINESAQKTLNIQDPLGKEITQLGVDDEERKHSTIAGVIRDYHFESLHNPIRSLLLRPLPHRYFAKFVTVRLAPGTSMDIISDIKKSWHTYAGNQIFEYVFLDDHLEQIYKAEQRVQALLAVFTVLSILIACFGLFGLGSYMTQQRTKEIGIRKVIGASVTGIVNLLSREFLMLVALANLLAWPLAYWAMSRWLTNFAYRVHLEFTSFIMATVLTVIIAFITVSGHSIKAALINPTKALRYE
ncbi:ABC transporter permease [bacterium]|nr:ABC transporter permease [candidate division CSSED10-310 bacterium]